MLPLVVLYFELVINMNKYKLYGMSVYQNMLELFIEDTQYLSLCCVYLVEYALNPNLLIEMAPEL